MLIKEELYETGKLQYCCLAGAWIPEWFDQLSRAPTCFWFSKKIPQKILCLLIAPVLSAYCTFPMLFINGKAKEPGFSRRKEPKRIGMDHTYIFDLRRDMLYDVAEVNGWNHVEVRYKDRDVIH